MDGDLHCIYLKFQGKLGEPLATRCKIYDKRYIGMPIFLVSAAGIIEGMGTCTFGDKIADEKEIIAKGIGKGCSMELVNE